MHKNQAHAILSYIMVEAPKRHPIPGVISSEASPGIIGLTPEEMEFLQGLADGLTFQESGERYAISPNTVKVYRSNIIRASHEVNEETGCVKLIKAGILDGSLVNNHPTKPFEPLSQREQDVIQSLYGGNTRKKTCEHLGISNDTLKSTLTYTLNKYGVDNLFAAIAMHAGIIKEQNSS